MKNSIRFSIFILICLAGSLMAFSFSQKKPEAPAKSDVKWLTWQEAVELNKKEPKKILVDVYTDWCGWCKVMDKETFTNDTVATYLAEKFYCVKLDAEMKSPIDFNGHKFEYIAGQGRGGVHTLAYSLLDGQLGYPTIVYLTENYERVVISPGFKRAAQLMTELKFTADEVYKNKTWQEYQTAGQ